MKPYPRAHHGFISKITFLTAASANLSACSYWFLLFHSAEEQAQQRLQVEETEEQYQSILRVLNATTRKTQKKE